MKFVLRPARDHGLGLSARLRSHRREPGLLSRATHLAWTLLVRCYLAVAHRLHITGQEHLPAPPFVLIANHTSHLDALTLRAVLPWSVSPSAFALAAADTFFTSLPAAGFAAFAINALPLWRKRTSERDLSFLRQRLAEDRVVFILFPEGTRSRSGAMAAFRPGIGALVAGSEVPVVPCAVRGAHAAWPAERRLPRPRKLAVRIGAPLRFAATSNDRAGWSQVAAACEAAVRALGAGEPAQRALSLS